MKRIFLITGIVLIFVHVGFVSFAFSQPELKEVTIATAPDPQLATQVIVAEAKNYYEEEGIKVKIKFFLSGADLMSAVASKNIHLAAPGGVPTVNLRAGGVPIKLLARQSDISDAQAIVVKPEIKTPKDLEGKKIGIFKGSGSEALLNSFIKAYNVDKGRLKILHMTPSENLAGFIRGDTAALVCWEPWILKARKAGGHNIISGHHTFVRGKKEYKKFFGDNSSFLGREEFLAAYPKTVEAVLRALAKAVDYIESNPDDVANILAKRLKLDVDDVKVMMGENKYAMKIDNELAEDYTNLISFLYSIGKLKSRPDVKDLFEPSFLKRVRPEWVTWKP
jgi:ABC-type nitrate/sulfonate/bicarbonate transport system substrate-binding protein